MNEDRDMEELDTLIQRLTLFVISVLIIMAFIMLGGCASDKELQMGYDAQVRAIQVQAQSVKPVVELKCGDNKEACKGLTFSYTPRQQLIVPNVTNTNDTISNITPSIVTGVGYVAGAVAATKIFSDFADIAGGGTVTHNTNVINGDNNTSSASTAQSTETNNFADSPQDNSTNTPESPQNVEE